MTTLSLDLPDLVTATDGPPRSWLPSAESVVDACIEAAEEPTPELTGFFQQMGAPALDLLVTTMSARAGLLGAQGGRALYHHELRGRLPMPPELEPEVAVWQEGTVPVWREGVLEEPKYFSFFQDAPFAAFNPNHRRKWRAHELLHGAVGWFWRPQMTRFELYVGARLNELVPVIHWYGLDEIFRPRCPRHAGEVLYREFCPACEAAARPFWELEGAEMQARRGEASAFVETAFEHFIREMEACRAEIETGRVHQTPRGRLDASSDSRGYLKGHWNRMTAWSFGSWVELFLVEGIDYVDRLDALAERVESTVRWLISGRIEVRTERFEALRRRRLLQDVAYRAFLALEWLEPGSSAARDAEHVLLPRLEAMAQEADALRRAPAQARSAALDELFEAWAEVKRLFPDEVAAPFRALGYGWEAPLKRSAEALAQVEQGLSTAVPETWESIGVATQMEAFVDSPRFDEHGRLAGRFARWLADQGDPMSHLARLEAWLTADPRVDSEAEDFGVLPEALGELDRPGRLRLNTTFRRARFPGHVLAHAFEVEGDEELDVAAVIFGGELRMTAVDEVLGQILERVADEEERGWLASVEPEVVLELIGSGFLVWLPRPK